MAVIISKAAEADLEKIGDWIARDNPQRAFTFVTELRGACQGITAMPEGYAAVSRYAKTGVIRRRVYGQYLIFYRLAGPQIFIVRVLHGGQDYEAVLFPDG